MVEVIGIDNAAAMLNRRCLAVPPGTFKVQRAEIAEPLFSLEVTGGPPLVTSTDDLINAVGAIPAYKIERLRLLV
jgi:hypothetical protein